MDHASDPIQATTKTKKPISPAELAANRANGRLGRGPITPQGKSRAKFNNLQHGRCAELILPGESAEALQHRLETWAADFDARTDSELYLAGRVTHASWRMDRSQKAERNALLAPGPQRRAAVRRPARRRGR